MLPALTIFQNQKIQPGPVVVMTYCSLGHLADKPADF